MPDIVMDCLIKASPERVFPIVSTGRGLEAWWTKRSTGEPAPGAAFELGFGPGYDWRATVITCVPDRAFELQMVAAHEDWIDTRVGFALDGRAGQTTLHFHHTGWPAANEHWRVSAYCWAMYLRVMRRHIEHGEDVPYGARLSV